MSRVLVLVHRSASRDGGEPVPLGPWPDEKQARAWLARQDVLHEGLRARARVVTLRGAREIDDVLREFGIA